MTFLFVYLKKHPSKNPALLLQAAFFNSEKTPRRTPPSTPFNFDFSIIPHKNEGVKKQP